MPSTRNIAIFSSFSAENRLRFSSFQSCTWYAGPSASPIFATYATLVFPLELESSRDQARPAEDRFDDALLRVLCAHTKPQPWWLGFLDTGASDVVLDDAPRVRMYSGWNYVLAQAGPPARSRYGRNVDSPVIMEPFLLNMYAFMPVPPFAWTTAGLPRSPAPSIARRRHQPQGATSRAILHQ